MDKIDHVNTNIVNLSSARSVKDFVLTANDRITALEQALYDILDCHRLDVAHEIAAEILNEDLDSYFAADDLSQGELDFDNDELIWEMDDSTWEED